MKTEHAFWKRWKDKIDRELNPCQNMFDNTRDDFKESISIDWILESLEITKFEEGT